MTNGKESGLDFGTDGLKDIEGTQRLFVEEVLVDLKIVQNCDITTLEQFQTYAIFPQES